MKNKIEEQVMDWKEINNYIQTYHRLKYPQEKVEIIREIEYMVVDYYKKYEIPFDPTCPPKINL